MHPLSAAAGPSEPHSATLRTYTARLNTHISATRAHFQPDPDEYIPSNEWTSEDKAPFFPSLNRHSSLRPDLIARDVDKKEDEVERYLRFLSESQTLTRSDRLKRTGRLGRDEWIKGIVPSAREVEEVDLLEEERLAAQLLAGGEGKNAEAGPSSSKRRKLDESAWGVELDDSKLESLAALIHTSTPADPLAGNKPAKIIRDEQNLATLLAIPHAQQTASQQKEVRRLTDKKKMRNRYRKMKLIEEGMTAEEITAHGGPDAVYLSRSGLDSSSLPATPSTSSNGMVTDDPLRGNKHAKIIRDEACLSVLLAQTKHTSEETIEIRRLTNKKRARQRSRKKKLLEEGMTEEDLAGVDVDAVFAKRAGIAWDADAKEEEKGVMSGMREWVSERGLDMWDYRVMSGRLGDLSTSFEVLEQMRVYLTAFLTPILLRAISIAEMEAVDVTATHVRMALQRGLPTFPEVKEEEAGEECEWEIMTTTTDREEEELDTLLDDVDTAYDIVQEEEPGDWDDPFGVEIKRKGGKEAKGIRIRKSPPPPLGASRPQLIIRIPEATCSLYPSES